MAWEKVGPGVHIADLHRDGNFYVVVRRPDVNGGKRRVRKVGPDRASARAIATSTLQELAAVGSVNVSGSVLLEEFLEHHARTLRRRTEIHYRGLVKNHLKPFFGNREATSLRKSTFFDFGTHVLGALEHEERVKRFRVVEGSLSCMRAALNWYWEEHELTVPNPARFIAKETKKVRKRYEVPARRRRHPYSKEQAGIILALATEMEMPTTRDLWEVAFGTGMRLGEILGMQWSDVRYDAQRIYPEWQIDDRGKPVPFKSDDEDEWKVRAPGALFERFARRRLARTSDRWIFANSNGDPFRPDNVQRWLKKIREKAKADHGIPMSLTFHCARHTFATRAMENGWSLEEVRAQLDHHSAAFTATQYTHIGEREISTEWAAVDAGTLH